MIKTPSTFYATQANSGSYSQTNCAPACVAMALRYQRGIMTSVRSIRDTVSTKMFWNDITLGIGLTLHKVKYHDVQVYETQDLDDLLNGYAYKKGVVIINVNMWHVRRGKGINKPYSTLHPFWKHYLVVTGVTDDGYYSVLDPYTNDPVARLYSKQVLVDAMQQWNRNAHLIEKDG